MFLANANGGNTKVEVVHKWDTDGRRSVELLMNDVTAVVFSNDVFKDYQAAVTQVASLMSSIAMSDGTTV